MSNLAFVDFDNTLVYRGQLSSSVANKLTEYLKHNKVCILTYTDYSEIKNMLESYNINCDFFSFLSQMGVLAGKEFKFTIDHSLLNILLKNYDNYIYTAYFKTDNETLIYNFQDRLQLFYPSINRRIVTKLVEDNVTSCFFAVDINKKEEFLEEIKNDLLSYEIIAEDKNRFLITASINKLSKADVVTYLTNKIKPCKTIGIGDSDSDLDFISKCDIKIAMKNSTEKVKSACDIITPADASHDGCIDTLLSIQ